MTRTHLRTVGSWKWLTMRSIQLPLVVLPVGVFVLLLLLPEELGVGVFASTSLVAGLLLLLLVGLGVGLGVLLTASTSVVAGLLLFCRSARRGPRCSAVAACTAAVASECTAPRALRSNARR